MSSKDWLSRCLSRAGPHAQVSRYTSTGTLDGRLSLSIDSRELSASLYGKSTAGAVLLFKKKGNIINRSYQTRADNIVGKMTIAALDRKMLAKERQIRTERFLSMSCRTSTSRISVSCPRQKYWSNVSVSPSHLFAGSEQSVDHGGVGQQGR